MKTKEAFIEGKNNIGWVGSTFKEKFYDTSFIVKEAEGLQTKTLERSMNDREILAELKPQAVTLGDVLVFLSKANKSDWYIFYVNDTKGTLWAVSARWFSGYGGWFVEAYSVGGPGGWSGGYRVVSREFTQTLKTPQTLSTSDALNLISEIEERLTMLKKLV